MKIEISLNESIKVKLTEHGINILKEKHEELQEYLKYRNSSYKEKPFELKLDDEGYYHTQLWCFMNNFGEHLFNGAKNSINPINIIIEREVK